MSGWAASLSPDAARSAAALRLEPGIEVLELPGALWLRGEAADERLESLLVKLPGARRYTVLTDGQLRPVGSRLPQGRLPAGNWQKIKDWAAVELPVPALAARTPEPVPLRIVRPTTPNITSPPQATGFIPVVPGSKATAPEIRAVTLSKIGADGGQLAESNVAGWERAPAGINPAARFGDANILIIPLDAWVTYGTDAPQVRLNRLRFAVSSDERVIVQGSPLPPLPGERFYERAGVALPCGWGWSPAIEPDLLRTAWKLGPHDLALVRPDGSWEHIRGEQFVRATRSAIRQSAEREPA
jgi:hypothetical protein